MTDVAAAASYLISAIAETTDAALAEEVLEAIDSLLPYNIDLDNVLAEAFA
jgi:hypothetical protein